MGEGKHKKCEDNNSGKKDETMKKKMKKMNNGMNERNQEQNKGDTREMT